MSRIRGKNTKPELLVRKGLFAMGFRYKIHDKNLPGKPDIVLPKYKTAVFVHGCFWHSHTGCRFSTLPKSNQEYWLPKIKNNALRDIVHQVSMQELGWKVLVIWECELKKPHLTAAIEVLARQIRGSTD